MFIAGLFTLAAKEMAALAAAFDRETDSDFYQQQADKMAAATLAHGWDGEWFLRAYDNFGDKIGSSQCAEGQIFIEPQGMCVMAGIGVASGEAAQAVSSVGKRLATPHGIVLHQPAYTRYYLNLGEISTYPPGYKENAGIFCHTNPWIMIAAALIGDGDLAFDYYKRINPSVREAISEVHRSEPYVYAQMIAGSDAPTHGEAKNSWLSGTAAYNYVAITQWILGIRPMYDGLQIAPVLPKEWPGFSAVRIFRGVTYHIEVERIGSGNAASLAVDGKAIVGNVAPMPRHGRSDVHVHVIIR